MSHVAKADTADRQPGAGPSDALRLSVIVPTFNRAPILEKCLASLGNQSCSHKQYEIIVADDGSSDATRATVEGVRAAAANPEQIRYLHQNNSGANAARNRAIRAARGPVLLFINDDIIATPAMLAEHLAGHDRLPDDRVAVLGRVTLAPSLRPSRLSRMHLDHAYARLSGRSFLDWRSFFTCNVSVKRSLLERGGMFEERIRYHEDLELAERLSHHGLEVAYCPKALGYHDHLLTEEEFLAVAVREAQALVTWARLAPDRTGVLGTLGYVPGMPLGWRIRRRLAGLVVRRATLPFWRWMARRCPDRLEVLSRVLYSQIYQCLMAEEIRQQLRSP